MGHRILLVENDAAFRGTVRNILELNGFEVAEAGTGKAGIAETVRSSPALVIVDLVMPGIDGLEVCQTLKQDHATAGIPLLILTGHDKEGQDIACLDMGADDYLTKPVKTKRLLAHVHALLRRSHAENAEPPSELTVGGLRLDYEGKAVGLAGKSYAHLTPKEFGLLYELALIAPKPLDRGDLYRKIWGMEPPSQMSLRTVEVHVRRIRLKLRWKNDVWLVTIQGRGYALIPPHKRHVRE